MHVCSFALALVRWEILQSKLVYLVVPVSPLPVGPPVCCTRRGPMATLERVLYPVRAVLWGSATSSALVAACLGLSASAIVRPFSHRMGYDMSSFVAGTLWRFMQWIL